MEKSKYQVLLSEGQETLIIREGHAPDIKPPLNLRIEGDIFAPGEFFKKKTGAGTKFHPQLCTVMHDKDKGYIKFTFNETDPELVGSVTGNIVPDPVLEIFKINTHYRYSTQELYRMLKLKRAYFSSKNEHANLLKQLETLDVKTQQEFTNANDLKGNTAQRRITSVTSNLQLSFILYIPIFKGGGKKSFVVEIEVEPYDGSIVCYLVSPDLAELQDNIRRNTIEDELATFAEFPIIHA